VARNLPRGTGSNSSTLESSRPVLIGSTETELARRIAGFLRAPPSRVGVVFTRRIPGFQYEHESANWLSSISTIPGRLRLESSYIKETFLSLRCPTTK
jgi:hypothetical protein